MTGKVWIEDTEFWKRTGTVLCGTSNLSAHMFWVWPTDWNRQWDAMHFLFLQMELMLHGLFSVSKLWRVSMLVTSLWLPCLKHLFHLWCTYLQFKRSFCLYLVSQGLKKKYIYIYGVLLQSTLWVLFQHLEHQNRHPREHASQILPAPTTPRAKVTCPDPETPHAHYLDHIHENGPPSPLQVADSPWTKRLKSWYCKQLVSGPVIDLSDDEVDALDEKPETPELAHVDSPSSEKLFEHEKRLQRKISITDSEVSMSQVICPEEHDPIVEDDSTLSRVRICFFVL